MRSRLGSMGRSISSSSPILSLSRTDTVLWGGVSVPPVTCTARTLTLSSCHMPTRGSAAHRAALGSMGRSISRIDTVLWGGVSVPPVTCTNPKMHTCTHLTAAHRVRQGGQVGQNSHLGKNALGLAGACGCHLACQPAGDRMLSLKSPSEHMQMYPGLIRAALAPCLHQDGALPHRDRVMLPKAGPHSLCIHKGRRST